MQVVAGPPVDLSRYQGKELTAQVLREATEDIMTAITEVLAEIRGERPPAERFDLRKAARARGREHAERRDRALGTEAGSTTGTTTGATTGTEAGTDQEAAK